MSRRKSDILLAVTLLGFMASACNAFAPQREPGPAPTQVNEPVFTQSPNDLPRTEAEVPRVTVKEAKAALESGAAIIVDVRSAGAYEASHIAGAVHLPLEEIEINPSGLNLDREQWIITYCT